MFNAKELREEEVSLHPCSIENMPGVDFTYAVGMYELNEELGTRMGCVSINRGAEKLHTYSVDAGILDMKFSANYLACVLSTSKLSVLTYDNAKNDTVGNSVSLSSVFSTEDVYGDDGLFLSVDWRHYQNNFGAPMDFTALNNTLLATSTQSGKIRVFSCHYNEVSGFSLTHQKCLTDIHKLYNHTQPIWTTTFDPHSGHTGSIGGLNTILTGGDDGKFKLWDLRCVDTCTGKEEDEVNVATPSPTMVSNFHAAGVTSAQYHPTNPNILATGSYDQQLCIWDKRKMKSPLASVDTG